MVPYNYECSEGVPMTDTVSRAGADRGAVPPIQAAHHGSPVGVPLHRPRPRRRPGHLPGGAIGGGRGPPSTAHQLSAQGVHASLRQDLGAPSTSNGYRWCFGSSWPRAASWSWASTCWPSDFPAPARMHDVGDRCRMLRESVSATGTPHCQTASPSFGISTGAYLRCFRPYPGRTPQACGGRLNSPVSP